MATPWHAYPLGVLRSLCAQFVCVPILPGYAIQGWMSVLGQFKLFGQQLNYIGPKDWEKGHVL